MKAITIIWYLVAALAVAVSAYFCERVARKELEKRAAFNAKAAEEWQAYSKECLALAEGSRVRHVETGKIYTVYGYQINHGQTEEWEPRLELLVYMYDQFGFIDAAWFEPLNKEGEAHG